MTEQGNTHNDTQNVSTQNNTSSQNTSTQHSSTAQKPEQSQMFNFKEQFNKYLLNDMQMDLETKIQNVNLIKELVKVFQQTDQETRKQIFDYYKSKDYLKKYLEAEDVKENVETSTQAIQFIKQALTNEDDIKIRAINLIGRMTKMKSCQVYKVPVSFVDMDIELPEIKDDIVFQTLLWKHVSLFSFYIPNFDKKQLLPTTEDKMKVVQKFLLISEPHRIQSIINTYPDYIKTYPVIYKLKGHELRQDYYNYLIICRMQEFKSLLSILTKFPIENINKLVKQQSQLYQEFPTIILDLVLDIQLYYLKFELYRHITKSEYKMTESLFKSMLKDNHDPRKYALFREYMKDHKDKAEQQQQDFEKVVDILTYNIFEN